MLNVLTTRDKQWFECQVTSQVGIERFVETSAEDRKREQ